MVSWHVHCHRGERNVIIFRQQFVVHFLLQYTRVDHSPQQTSSSHFWQSNEFLRESSSRKNIE